jgi:hypothetical protein
MASPTRPPLEPIPTVSPTSIESAGSGIQPSSDQVVVLYVMIAYSVIIFGVWNVPIFKMLINPLKLFTIGWHELCHIIMGIMTGGRIVKITIDPTIGGATIVEGGRPPWILSAGYIGSTFFGALFVLAGWDTLVAKVMSFILAIGLLMPLALVRDKLTILLTFVYEVILIACWFIAHAQALRWYCLFIGVMNILFVIWDFADDRYFNKVNDSDATQFSLLYPSIGPHTWALFWMFFQLAVLAGFVCIGLVGFKRTTAQMNAEAAKFLPT